MSHKSYPAKVLLFGEYTIIKGAQALAIPYDGYSASWQQQPGTPQAALLAFVHYLTRQPQLPARIRLADLQSDLGNGLYLQSDIPIGFGLGSSGAVCAAVFDRYKTADVDDIPTLRHLLAVMENHFHGSSSGIDPLVCYLNQPLLFEPDTKRWQQAELPKSREADTGALFLLNTSQTRQTEPLVRHFLQRCEEPTYLQRLEAELMGYNEEAIASFLQGRWKLLFEHFHDISLFQYRYFAAMLPHYLRPFWQAGLEGKQYKLKLCGAGGGGFMLGCTGDWPAARQALEPFELLPLVRW